MLNLGQINLLKVKKQTDISYILTDGIDDVFLHVNQSLGILNIGDEVRAFLYFDQKKRLCATLESPLITTTKYDYVEVVGINAAGVFINIGIAKDILLSKDYLPHQERYWPRIGTKIPCILRVKKNQLVAKIISFEDVKSSFKENEEYIGLVINYTKTGIVVATSDFNLAYINNNLLRKSYYLGEEIKFKVKELKNGIYNATTIENKEKELLIDSDIILNYLKTFGGMMPLGNLSTPDEIYKITHMSKSAFKRAVGHLYKERLITIQDHKILLNSEK